LSHDPALTDDDQLSRWLCKPEATGLIPVRSTSADMVRLRTVDAFAERPFTGSAHTDLAPYWCDRLARTSLTGLQASARSGFVGVELSGDRVAPTGRAVAVFDGALSETAEPRLPPAGMEATLHL
jgi:predicted PhzF superfamily epimerase YddE/YHI9